MAKKAIDTSFPKPWKPEAAGESKSGIYIGSDTVPAGPKVEKAFTAYQFKTPTGEKWSVSGDALRRAMEQIPRGTDVEIVYKGTQPSTKKGRNPFKVFEVLVDDSVALSDGPLPADADDFSDDMRE